MHATRRRLNSGALFALSTKSDQQSIIITAGQRTGRPRGARGRPPNEIPEPLARARGVYEAPTNARRDQAKSWKPVIIFQDAEEEPLSGNVFSGTRQDPAAGADFCIRICAPKQPRADAPDGQ